jgi:hypothetical protein
VLSPQYTYFRRKPTKIMLSERQAKMTPKKQTQKTVYTRGNSYYNPAFLGHQAEPAGGGKVMPPAVLRSIAHKSESGGTAYCHYCNMRFAMYYMKMCKISSFLQDHVCADCRKEHPGALPVK